MRMSPLNFGFGSGDAGVTSGPQPITADLSRTGRDWNNIPMGVTPPSEVDQNAPAQGQGTPWSPSFAEHLQAFLAHPGTWGETGDHLATEHGAALFAQRLAGERDAAGDGMAPGARFALDADPASYATSMNENYKPRVVAAGDTAMGFGHPVGMAPKTGVTPQGVGYVQNGNGTAETGRLDTPQTANEAAQAANEAEKTRLAGLLNPAQILHLDRIGRAALTSSAASMVNANNPGSGGPGGVGGRKNALAAAPAGWK